MPDELKKIIEHQKNIYFLGLDSNKGYSFGNNRGWEFLCQKHSLDYVILSNSDIIFYKTSIQKMLEYYHNRSGISFPKILTLDGISSYPDSIYARNIKEIYRRLFLRRKYFTQKNAIDMDSLEPVETHLNLGSCFIMDKQSMEVLLPLDENSTLYFEEMMLSYRADEAGIRIAYNPNSVVLHKEGRSTGKKNPFAEMCRDEAMMYYSRNYIKANMLITFPMYLILIVKYGIKAVVNLNYRKYFKEYVCKLNNRWLGRSTSVK